MQKDFAYIEDVRIHRNKLIRGKKYFEKWLVNVCEFLLGTHEMLVNPVIYKKIT